MVRWWLKNDMKQSPEEIAEYFATVIQPVVENDHTSSLTGHEVFCYKCQQVPTNSASFVYKNLWLKIPIML